MKLVFLGPYLFNIHPFIPSLTDTCSYEYNFKTGQFRFTKPLSRAQTTAFDLVKWLILRSLNSIRTQHLPTWLQDQNYAYPRLALGCCLINGTEVYKVPDVQFRFPYSWEKRYSAAHANVVGVVGIAWLGSNRRVTEEIVGFLKYAKGGIYFGVILRIGCDFEHPERTPNPAATFDILRYKASDGNGKRVVQIQRSSYVSRPPKCCWIFDELILTDFQRRFEPKRATLKKGL